MIDTFINDEGLYLLIFCIETRKSQKNKEMIQNDFSFKSRKNPFVEISQSYASTLWNKLAWTFSSIAT
jgi:hypothetical protein